MPPRKSPQQLDPRAEIYALRAALAKIEAAIAKESEAIRNLARSLAPALAAIEAFTPPPSRDGRGRPVAAFEVTDLSHLRDDVTVRGYADLAKLLGLSENTCRVRISSGKGTFSVSRGDSILEIRRV